MMPPKVGIGYDIHRLVVGRKLFLGGVEIPFSLGLKGHSDADVLLHAICDALLGASAGGDIGEHFPNTDKRFKNISSLILLKEVVRGVRKKGFQIGNIDAVVIAEEPRIKSYQQKMCSVIAGVLKISAAQVNIKATTQEGLGFGGATRKAIAAYAVALLVKRKGGERLI